MNETTVSISSARSVLHYLTHHQFLDEHSQSKLLTELDISPELLADQEARLPIAKYHQLWEKAKQLSQDPAIGLHVGQQSSAELMGLVANVLVHSDSLEQGIEQYVRLFSLVNNGIELTFDKQGSISVIEFHHHKPEFYCQQDMERTLALAVQRTKQYVNDEIRMEKIGVAHSAPPYADQYEALFGCPVEFDQDVCSITFASRFLQFSPKQKNPYVRSALQRYAEAINTRLFKRKIGDKVKDIVLELLPHGQADIDRVAQRLHMSRQTLYRKLKKENLVFQELVEEIRQEKALEIIKDKSHSLSEIAFVLGFSELSAFSRAFKRWTGKSPKQYRNDLDGA
jgi:AraC-like DNA-binding protein